MLSRTLWRSGSATLLLLGIACGGESPAPGDAASGGSGGLAGGGTSGGLGGGAGSGLAGGAGSGGNAGSATGSGSMAGASGTGALAGAGSGGSVAGGAGTSGANTGGAGAAGASMGGAGMGGAGMGGAGVGGAAGAGMGGATGGDSGIGGATAGNSGMGGTTAGAGAAAGSAGASGAGAGGGGTGGSAGGTSQSELCPSGITRTLTVAKSGGQFSSVQAAIDSIQSGSSERIRIDIGEGTFTEKLTIASRTNLCLVGAGATETILSYNDANATIGSTSGSASVHVGANDFSAANLTIQNSYGTGSQAVALRVTGERQQFSNCRFVGYQDTLYTHSGSQYFRDCYVQGNVDYVFGGATAVLQNCEVRNVEGGSAVAAPSTEIGKPYGIVFLGGRFTAVSSVGSNSVALGRPWGEGGSATYLNVELGAHISAAGFVMMSGNDPLNARFGEYGSTGPGANPSAHQSYQLSAGEAAEYTLDNIFGSWTPSYSE
jgi:pectin methylesterase-like acyl-CoA thioesterase